MPIYTLTPNPALDVSGHAKDIIPNEKNYVFSENRDPGGNGINASRIITRLIRLKRLKFKSVALGFIGGSTGDEIRGLLKKEAVLCDFIQIAGLSRINVTVSNDRTHQQTRLTFPGPQVTTKEIEALGQKISQLKPQSLLLIGGSLPRGCSESFHGKMARIADQAGVGVILDVPAKSYAWAFKSKVKYLLVKPNQTELEQYAGRKFKTDQAICEGAKTLLEHAHLVVVSLADRGAILVSAQGSWFAKAPKIKARGTVGAGDSMVGAMATQLFQQRIFCGDDIEKLFMNSLPRKPRQQKRPHKIKSPSRIQDPQSLPPALSEMLKWGLAAGAATAEASGTQLALASEIQRLVKAVKITKIQA